MATIRDRYILEVDTSGATQALNTFKVAVGGIVSVAAAREILQLTARFEDLRSSLGTVTGSAESASRAFDFIKRFATETQFSVEDLTQTYIQLRAAGIEPTERLLRSFSDAAAVTTDQVGSLQAITALLSRTTGGGLGLEELERLADRGIPVYKILGEQLGITREEVSKFGQTAEGARTLVEALLVGIESEFGGATASRINNLSTVMSNFGESIQNVVVAFGDGLSPAVKEVLTDLTAFLNNNQDLARTLGELSGEVIRAVAESVKALAASFDAVSGEGLKALFADLIDGLAAFIDGFVSGIRTLIDMLATLIDRIVDVGAAMGAIKTVGLIPGMDRAQTIERTLQLIEQATKAEKEWQESASWVTQQVSDNPYTQQLEGMRAHLRMLQDSSYAVEGEFSSMFDTGAVNADGFSARLREIAQRLRESAAAADVYPDAILRMVEAEKRAAEAAGAIVQSAGEGGAAPATSPMMEYFNSIVQGANKSVGELEFARQSVEALNEQLRFGVISPEVYAAAMEKLNGVLGVNNDETAAAIRAQEALNAARAQATELVDGYTRSMSEGITGADRELNRLGMTPLQRQLDEISTTLTDDLQEQLRSLNNIEGLPAEELRRQAESMANSTREAIELQQQFARESYEIQRSFAYGWDQAFQEYADSATNAAQQARDIFAVTTRGLEDLIVEFSRTGKFEINKLAEEITETLLRQNFRAALAKTLEEGGSATDLAQRIKESFGAIPGAQPVDVEALAQSLSPVLDLMKQNGAMGEAQAQLRGQSIGDALYVRIVNDDILGAIQNDAIGDRLIGPREEGALLEGQGAPAAPVNVTYNINAVDARSFKQLVAADPEFIHAVASYGARATPSRRI